MTAPPSRLPHDLQARLDVILARPALHRAPTLRDAIRTLVLSAYERQAPSSLTADQRTLLEQLQAGEDEGGAL